MKKMSKTLILSLLLAAGITLSACGSKGGTSSAQTSSQQTSSEAQSEVVSPEEKSEESKQSEEESSAELPSSEDISSEEESESEEISSEEESESEEISSEEESSEEISSEEESSEEYVPVPGDENWVDYVNDGSVSLNLDYENRDFYVDGIGQFDLKTAIDGDTAHFTPLKDTLNKGTMKARFYGIDTPESTGKVQQYGKPASNFTKEKLKEAAANGTIVISSAQDDYGEPNPDSTGSRYVSLVWINLTKKNAPKEELILLNLWIVQVGLSWVKNVQSMPQYADTFYAAEEQAKTYKLNLHSGQDDGVTPTGDFLPASLLEIKYEILQSMNDPEHVNAFDNTRITVQGTVAGFSDHILYLQDYVYYDNERPELGGEYCGINIFVGMSEIPSKYTKINTFLQVSGLAQDSENFGFQMTDTQGRFPIVSTDNPTDAQIIYKAAENEETEHNLYKFDFSIADLSAIASATDPYDLTCLNCYVVINEELTVNRVFVNDSLEITLYFTGATFNCYIPFTYKGDPDEPGYRWKTEADFLGKTFRLEGVYVHHKTASGKNTFQIIPNGQAGLTWVKEDL